jgi:hypothetical protein
MGRKSPTAGIAVCGNLAGRLESRVGGVGTFLSIIEPNTLQIFVQIEKIEFT